MKKALAILLCTSLLLAGCNKQQDTNPSTEPQASATTESETVPVTQPDTEPSSSYAAPLNAISMPIVLENTYGEDGKVIFTYAYQKVHMTHQEPAIAKSVVLDLMNRIDKTASGANQICEAAKANYNGEENWNPYLSKVMYRVERIDSGVLSLLGTNVSYTGGNHPNFSNSAATFDLAKGTALSFPDIVSAEFSAPQMIQLITDALSGEENLYDDYAKTVEANFSNGLESIKNWYFSVKGLCFYFAPYEIAPYAAGTVVAEVPYEKLIGVIRDEYFPSERPDGYGDHVYAPFSETDLSQFNRFTELITAKEAPQYLLYTDGLLYDIRIESGSYYESNGEVQFAPEATVFAASHLTTSDAIMIQTNHILRLTYSNGDETVTAYLGEKGVG